MSTKQTLQSLGYEAAHLDEAVHSAASSLASNANNAGVSGQIEFLTNTCGWSEKDIVQFLENETATDNDD